MNLTRLAGKSHNSSFYRWLLSRGLNTLVPFNRPHKLKIEEISSEHLMVKLPYIKRNLNHVKGLHACALATLAEVCSGFLIISRMDPVKYRIILEKLEMDYFYQGKTDAWGIYKIDEAWLNNEVLPQIDKEGKTSIKAEVVIRDSMKNHLATGKAYWQIKVWKDVKTKS